jgi:hypothetical protein
MKTTLSAIAACIALFSASAAWSQIPHTFSVQGLLTQEGGTFPTSGYHQIQFNFYDVATGGTPMHSETQSILINGGVVNAILGGANPFESALQFDHKYYLGMRIDGGAEMAPRTEITATPYAIRADMANVAASALHADVANNAGHADEADNANHATTADVATDLSPNSTSVVRSLNNRTGNLKLVGGGNTSVTQSGDTFKITTYDNIGISTVRSLDAAIGVANPSGPDVYLNLGGNSITSWHLADGGVATVDLANGAVTEPKIGPNAVPAPKMSTFGATMMGQVLMYDGMHTTPVWSNMFMGNGCGLTLNASKLCMGTVPDERLSENVALRNAENNFTGDVNTFRGVAAGGVAVNSAPDGKALEITRGRTILSYGSVTSGNVIPSDISVANVQSNNSFSMATAGFPASGENGQILYVACDDPQGCRILNMANNLVGGQENSLIDLGTLMLHNQVSMFVKTENGWLKVY